MSAGTRYGELGVALQAAGLALPNTGSLPHISVAGAVATGTHGSGIANPVLGRGVRALSMVLASGDLVTVDRDSLGEPFDGHVLALGRLGIVTELVLDVVPTFDIAQTVIVGVSDHAVGEGLDAILSAAYSVSVFTTWAPDQSRIWVKALVETAARRLGHGSAVGRSIRPAEPQHPVPGEPTGSATAQLGVPGPWNERLPHFRLDFVPSAGDELQSEFLLPRPDGVGGLGRLAADARGVARGVAGGGDPRDRGRLDVAQPDRWPGQRGLPLHLDPGQRPGRCRWSPRSSAGSRPSTHDRTGARSSAPPDDVLATRYPRLADFRDLVSTYDPRAKLGNDLVDGWIGLAGGP